MRSAAIIVAILLSAIAAYHSVQQTTAFKAARARVLAMPEIESLGKPVSVSLQFFGYSIPVTDSSRSAEFTMDLKGPHGTAVARVRVREDRGQWSVIDSSLILEF